MITSSVTYQAEKIANVSQIFANKWRIRKIRKNWGFFVFVFGGVEGVPPPKKIA